MIFLSKILRGIHIELIIWPAALLFLAFSDPAAESHFSLCIFRLFGWETCPGCGLGHAISYLLHGDVAASWQAHPLGIAAFIILSARIITLFLKKKINIKYAGNKHGKNYRGNA
ncbi:MAG: DUF2752 domain-containing protein [bacterium]